MKLSASAAVRIIIVILVYDKRKKNVCRYLFIVLFQETCKHRDPATNHRCLTEGEKHSLCHIIQSFS